MKTRSATFAALGAISAAALTWLAGAHPAATPLGAQVGPNPPLRVFVHLGPKTPATYPFHESMHALREGTGIGYGPGPGNENQLPILLILTDSVGPSTGPNMPGTKIVASEAYEVDVEIVATSTTALNSVDTGNVLTAETDYDFYENRDDAFSDREIPVGNVYTFTVPANATPAESRFWVRSYRNQDSDATWEKITFRVLEVREAVAQTTYDFECPYTVPMGGQLPCQGHNAITVLLENE